MPLSTFHSHGSILWVFCPLVELLRLGPQVIDDRLHAGDERVLVRELLGAVGLGGDQPGQRVEAALELGVDVSASRRSGGGRRVQSIVPWQAPYASAATTIQPT